MAVFNDFTRETISKRDFISLTDFSREELEALMDLALDMKSGRNTQKYLANRTIGLLFSVVSTRTRISFQVGAHELGGHADFYNADELQLVHHESIIDTAEVMSRYLAALVVRMYDMNHYGQGRERLHLMAQHMNIPLINALDDKGHPCQIMADILTLKEMFGEDYKKKRIAFTWGYAKRQKSPGVPQSMLIAASILGMNIIFAHPRGFDLDDQYLEFARKHAMESRGNIQFCNSMSGAAEDADVIYVKSWKSLKMSAEEDRKIREKIRADWCVSARHIDRANPDVVFMNCLPIIRGEQATAEVIDGKHSIIYKEAENRLHIQKAIMASLIR